MNLLAQTLPGYLTDTPSTLFRLPPFVGRGSFISLFTPNRPGFSLSNLLAEVLLFATIISGLIFFVKLVSAGFAYLTSTGDTNKIQAATKEITNSTIGLIIVISTFFLAQIIEVVLGIDII
ncbi:MAG: hypothetical protein AAB768_02380 [Patescibacteria group bacterium]